MHRIGVSLRVLQHGFRSVQNAGFAYVDDSARVGEKTPKNTG